MALAAPPPCRSLGRQCPALDLTLRIADRSEDGPTLQDAATTWLLGHTERITFGRPYVEGDQILVDATVWVGCKYLNGGEEQEGPAAEPSGSPSSPFSCAAHGYRGTLPDVAPPGERPALRRGANGFRVAYRGKIRWLDLPLTRQADRARRRGLPVLNGNPCAGAPCRTADNTRRAACCRDLTLDVVAPVGDTETELLLRSRRSPYLCKVERADESIIECEVISACGYLDPDDGVSCVLHDRLLPNHQLAKPSICREWPSLNEDEVAHPGCRLVERA